MSPQPIRIRSAEPTYEDGLRFAHYVHLASQGKFRLLLGPRATQILATAFARPGHDLSYEHTLFAERDGEIVGMGSGYTAEDHRHANDQPLMHAAGRSAPRAAVLFFLASPVFRFLHTYADGDFYVQFLAVDEPYRRMHIGSQLLQALEDRARERGSLRFAIDVANRNCVARRVYERYGFATIDRWPRTRLVRPNVLRMVKPL